MSDIIYRIKRKYKNQNDFELFRLNKNKNFLVITFKLFRIELIKKPQHTICILGLTIRLAQLSELAFYI